MKRPFSERLWSDIVASTQLAWRQYGVMNVPILAEEVRLRNVADNVALEDIEHEILQQGMLLNAVIEFDRGLDGEIVDPVPAE